MTSPLDQILAPMPPEEQIEHLRALVDDLALMTDVLGQPWPGRVTLCRGHRRIVRRLSRGPASLANLGAAIHADSYDWADWCPVSVRVQISRTRTMLREAELAVLTRATGGAPYELQLLPGAPAPWAHVE